LILLILVEVQPILWLRLRYIGLLAYHPPLAMAQLGQRVASDMLVRKQAAKELLKSHNALIFE
jgi:hypothetical protein